MTPQTTRPRPRPSKSSLIPYSPLPISRAPTSRFTAPRQLASYLASAISILALALTAFESKNYQLPHVIISCLVSLRTELVPMDMANVL